MAEDVSKWKLDRSSGILIDQETGEAIPAPWTYIEPGGQYLSPQQVERNREYREMKEKELEKAQNEQLLKHIKAEQEKILGPFVYAKTSENAFCDLSPDTLARCVYLASFLRFGTEQLWQSQRARIRLTDLPNIMGFSQPTADRFWSKVKNRYFSKDDDGFINTMGDNFVMGRLESTPDIEYQKLYIMALQDLYRKVPLKQHKRLGYVLKMLPFLNFEYNLLCWNPTEREKAEIIPLTVEDFCKAAGFDEEHVDRLAKDYGRIRFTVAGNDEVFCKFIFDGDSISDAHIAINPRIIYKGSNFWKVEAIGISFAASAKPSDNWPHL